MQSFSTTTEYLSAFASNKALAVLPISQAAEVLEITPSAVTTRLRTDRLQGLQIGKTKFVLVAALQKVFAEFERDVDTVEHQLKAFVKADRVPVFYDPVMSPIGLDWRVPADRSRIGKILGAVSARTHKTDGVLLTVIVHRKSSGKTNPGDGFFHLAESLGYDWPDDDAFVEQQTKRVVKAYK